MKFLYKPAGSIGLGPSVRPQTTTKNNKHVSRMSRSVHTPTDWAGAHVVSIKQLNKDSIT